MSARRGGFALVELMVVVMVISILVRIAMPAYQQHTLRANADAIMGDISVVRAAAFSYYADHGEWPPDVNPGVTPPGLVPYLPDGFSFVGDGYTLDWDNWILPDGTPRHPETNVLVGISLAINDQGLGDALLKVVGPDAPTYTISEHYTFILAAR